MKMLLKSLSIIFLGLANLGNAQNAPNTGVYLEQVGDYQQAIIHQQQARQTLVSVKQLGVENNLFMLQVGASNVSIIQNGIENNYLGLLYGEKNELNVLQMGNNNQMYQFIDNDSGLYEYRQVGNNNSLTHLSASRNTQGALKIYQRGNNKEITVKTF